MNQHNSSISSSKGDNDKNFMSSKTNAVADAIKTGLWLVFFLALFDVGINLLFPYPSDFSRVPGNLNSYFNYGRSIEGKILRQVGLTDKSTGPLALVGWLNPQDWENKPVNPAPGEDLLIASYGMSFSIHLSEAMKEMDSRLTIRLVPAPGSPPNHSFTAYNLDRGQHEADVVILGVLASTVKGMTTLSSMTWASAVPAAMTYPKYIAETGSLKVVWPEIKSLEELRAAKYQNKQQWEAFVTQMRQQDPFFNSFIFEENFLDNSAIIRMIRRSIAQSHQAKITTKIHTQEGFNEELEEIAALKLIVKEFAVTAKQDGKLPIVLLFNNRGYDDHLYQLLRQTLEENSIPFVSTHNIVPATDIRNFIGDGHFTKSANKLIAEEVLKLMNQRLNRPAKNTQIIENLLTE